MTIESVALASEAPSSAVARTGLAGRRPCTGRAARDDTVALERVRDAATGNHRQRPLRNGSTISIAAFAEPLKSRRIPNLCISAPILSRALGLPVRGHGRRNLSLRWQRDVSN